MTWSVEAPVRAGDLSVVPIVDSHVSIMGNDRYLAGHGEKRPVLILVFREEGVIGVDLAGRVHSAEAIERRFPNAIETATASLASGANR